MRRTTAAILAALASGACGAERDQAPQTPSELALARGAPLPGTAAATSALDAEGVIEALGVDRDGTLVVVAEGRVFTLDGDTLTRRALYREGDDPSALGRVHHVAPRTEGGAWIAADAGLFALDGHYVTFTRLDVGSVRAVHEVLEGPLAGLWLTSDDGLLRWRGDEIERWDVPSLDVTPTSIALDARGLAALVVADGALALLEAEGGRTFADHPPLDAGEVLSIAGAVNLWAGTERGVVRRDATRTPAWTRFTLRSDDGAERVDAIAIDPKSSDAWARTQDALIRVHGEGSTRFDAAPLTADGRALVAVDARGDVFTADGATLVRLTPAAVEASVSFERDVRPWIVERCAACHSNQTQDFQDHRVFAALADAALTRVRSGDMPRCAGGLPCPEARLAPADYSVLEAWITAGRPE